MPRSWRRSPPSAAGIRLDHRSRRGVSPIRTTRSTSTRRPPTAARAAVQEGDRRRQAHLLREARRRRASRTHSNCYRLAEKAGVKHGVVQDKLWLPGMLKLKALMRQRLLRRDHLRVRGEFGYWVFEGDTVPVQRPSWNYRKEDGGGIIIDMLCHWRYVLDNLFGPVKAVSCLGATHIPTRWDEAGQALRLHRRRLGLRDLRTRKAAIDRSVQLVLVRARAPRRPADASGGRHQGTAVAGLRNCWIQPYGDTPRPVWNPDIESPLDYFDGWQKVPQPGELRQRLQAPVGAVPAPRL